MNKTARFPALITFILCITLVLSLSACASASEGEAISESTSDDGQGFEYHTPRLLGFIFDPDGEPIAFAEVGGEDFTTEDGVTSGDFLAYEGGWIPVTALGYASGYGRAHGEEQGSHFFETRLTPYQDMVSLEWEESTLLVGFQGDITWAAEVSGGLFSDPSAAVGLAVIDPDFVEARRAPYPGHPELRLRTALALEVFSHDLSAVDLNLDAFIPLTINLPSPLSEDAVFARFNLESGSWETLDLGCIPAEDNTYHCQLNILDPLIGLFDMPETFVTLADPSRGGTFSMIMAGEEDAFLDAWNALLEWIKSQEGAPGGVDHTDPTLNELVDDLGDAAMNFAAKNRTEKGKAKLGKAADSAMELGQYDIANELTAEMGKIAEELGEKALKEDDCSEHLKMLKAAAQIQILTINDALADEIIKKAGELVKDCDLWNGTIHVWMSTVSTHPSTGLDLQGYRHLWMEHHKVQIWTNVKTHAMKGESKISLDFSDLTYNREGPCQQEITYSGGGNIEAHFSGTFNGLAFQANYLVPTSEGGAVSQHWIMEHEKDDVCDVYIEKNIGFSPYYSILLHGLGEDVPPVSYQEVLDSSKAFIQVNGISRFDDSAEFVNPNPDLGVFPFEEGYVFWNFFHTNHKLPLKSE